MPPITKRRDGRGFEREIQALTRLRTAIVLDTKIDLATHEKVLGQIDQLVGTLNSLLRRELNLDSTPPPPALSAVKRK